jgi:hypothetical protein
VGVGKPEQRNTEQRCVGQLETPGTILRNERGELTLPLVSSSRSRQSAVWMDTSTDGSVSWTGASTSSQRNRMRMAGCRAATSDQAV